MTTVFHVGLSKTGTSALQTSFFPSLEGWAYVGQGSPRFAEFQPLFADLIESADRDYHPTPMRQLLEHTHRGRAGVIVSREQLTTFHRDGRTARRLHAVAPDAKILICVRNQQTRLPSAYSQYVRRGGVASFAEWATSVRDPARDRYDGVVGLYQGLFGREAVRVLLFEQLVEDEQCFLDELYGFIASGPWPGRGLELLPRANTSLAPSTISILRRVNRLTAPLRRHRKGWSIQRRIHRFAERWPTVPSRAPTRDAELLARLMPRYADSNDRLAELTGLDLARYGYPLPEGTPQPAA